MAADVLVLGIGNTLLSDEGVGVRLAQALAEGPLPDGVRVVDGGTIGLALLPLVQDAGAVLVLDAARLDAEPGTVRLFEAGAFDAFVAGRRATPHDVGLGDLVSALRLSGTMPPRRALLAVQPLSVGLGAELSEPVAAALVHARAAALALLERWTL
ncbi:MAG: hydrogenase maturation protease [Actinomycetota bacterium]